MEVSSEYLSSGSMNGSNDSSGCFGFGNDATKTYKIIATVHERLSIFDQREMEDGEVTVMEDYRGLSLKKKKKKKTERTRPNVEDIYIVTRVIEEVTRVTVGSLE